MHHLIDTPQSQSFKIEFSSNNTHLTTLCLMTPFSIKQTPMSLGLILETDNNQELPDDLPVIRIKTADSSPQLIEEKSSITLQAISDGIISIDANGYIDFINASAELMTGIDASDALDKKLDEVLELVDARTGFQVLPLLSNFKNHDDSSATVPHLLLTHRGSGFQAAVDIIHSPIVDKNNNSLGTVLVIRDISDLKHMSEQIIFQACHDSLTGLINRGEFERRLKKILLDTADTQQQHIMCYIDLDEFKIVNDTCGHLAGDELLRQISAHIKSHTKNRDLVARLGGDEFGLVLMDCDIEHARVVTERIRQSVHAHRFNWNNRVFHVGASIGVMMIDQHAGTLDDVLSTVDTACYQAKKSGRNQINFVNENDDTLALRKSEARCLELIRDALQHDNFQLYSQPIISLDGVADHSNHQELLLRMLTSEHEVLEPCKFLNTAARYHLLPEIDRWVIRHALARLSDSEDPLNDSNVQMTSINISAASVSDAQFVTDVIQYFKKSLVAPDKICFEIAESAVVNNIAQTTEFMLALSALGVHFAIDNFCNNLSSFSFIKKLPVDFLKIDGRLMQHLIEDEVDTALISAIRDISNILGIRTIAECVEDQYTFNALKTLGIDYAQGFHIAQPRSLLQQYEQCLTPSLNIH
jgi:diguanylate cyclase (GGDEF)-like protein/PAS domain S-box-containing protein